MAKYVAQKDSLLNSCLFGSLILCTLIIVFLKIPISEGIKDYSGSLSSKVRLLQENEYQSASLRTVAAVFGVIYSVAWGLANLPQVWLNWRRKRVDGMSLDYAFQNQFGFLSYEIYCIWQIALQELHGAVHAVEFSDLGFASLSFICGGMVFIQCFIYPRGDQKPSLILKLWLGLLVLFLLIMAILAISGVIPWATTLAEVSDAASDLSPIQQFLESFTFIQSLGYIKSMIVAVKYIPQILLNYKRKATIGLAIGFYYLDLTGAIASTIEMSIDSYNYGTLEFFFGNVPKLIILVVTYFYDIIIIFQHDVLYRKNNKKLRAYTV